MLTSSLATQVHRSHNSSREDALADNMIPNIGFCLWYYCWAEYASVKSLLPAALNFVGDSQEYFKPSDSS